jgi:FMN-dependent oxidoreductase (nitrilotriacetate monooxygenase family)
LAEKSRAMMKIGAFLRSYGHHVAAWRHPDASNDEFADYVSFAKTAERGLLDMLFFADNLTIFEGASDVLSRSSLTIRLDPFSLLSALAAVTEHVGLVCTATTTYDEPFHIARRFASLDLISHGRAGWNLVTSRHAGEALNFGREFHLEPAARYKRAREFAAVVTGLWDSWEDDAFERDKASGIFSDPKKMHVLDHVGENFRVRGPLNVRRSPQGRPVIVQAGSSDDGRDLSAEIADVVFTAHPTMDAARAFYSDIKTRVANYGRNPDDVKIMPGIFATIGRSEQEAREKYEELQSLVDPLVGLMQLSAFMQFDLTGYPVDGPLPDLPPELMASSRPALFHAMARKNNLTIRDLYLQMAAGRGHRQFIGTPEMVADELEAWFRGGAADGFNFMPPILPGGLDDFVDLVVPELQRRGLFRTAYEGTTLRENLGLSKPVNRHAPSASRR